VTKELVFNRGSAHVGNTIRDCTITLPDNSTQPSNETESMYNIRRFSLSEEIKRRFYRQVLLLSRPIMWLIVTFRGQWCSRLENPQTEQVKTCPAVATALNQLEPIDVAFDRPGTVG
jgi:hypothetical protein